MYTKMDVLKGGSDQYLIVHRLPNLFVLADTRWRKRGEEERDRLVHASSLPCYSVIRSAFASASSCHK